MILQSIQECWREYRDKVYPADMPADQNKDLHQAFFAGAYSALGEFIKRSEILSEEAAIKELRSLYAETEQICRAISESKDES